MDVTLKVWEVASLNHYFLKEAYFSRLRAMTEYSKSPPSGAVPERLRRAAQLYRISAGSLVALCRHPSNPPEASPPHTTPLCGQSSITGRHDVTRRTSETFATLWRKKKKK